MGLCNCTCVVQAGYARDEALLERVTSEWQLAMIQAAIHKLVVQRLEAERARGGSAVDTLADCATQLQREALCASTLFNDFAVVRAPLAHTPLIPRSYPALLRLRRPHVALLRTRACTVSGTLPTGTRTCALSPAGMPACRSCGCGASRCS